MLQVLHLPEDPKPLKVHNFAYQQRIPFMVSADFDGLMLVTDKLPAHESAAFEYQHHMPCSVSLKLVSTVPELGNIPYKEHHGSDCTVWLLQEVARLEDICNEWLFEEARMQFRSADRRKVEQAADC